VCATRRTKPPAGTGSVASGSKFSPEFTHQVPEMTGEEPAVIGIFGQAPIEFKLTDPNG
jgi:hypothetical protein